MKIKLIFSLIIAPLLPIGASYAMEHQLKLTYRASISFMNPLKDTVDKLKKKTNKNIAISKNFKAEGTFAGGINLFIDNKLIYFFQGSSNYVSAKLVTFNEDASLLAAYFINKDQEEIKIWETHKIKNQECDLLCSTIIKSPNPILGIEFGPGNTLKTIDTNSILVYKIQPITHVQPIVETPINPSTINNPTPASNNSTKKITPKNQSWLEKFLPKRVAKWIQENETLAYCLWAGTGIALFCAYRFDLKHKVMTLLQQVKSHLVDKIS